MQRFMMRVRGGVSQNVLTDDGPWVVYEEAQEAVAAAKVEVLESILGGIAFMIKMREQPKEDDERAKTADMYRVMGISGCREMVRDVLGLARDELKKMTEANAEED